MSGPGRTQAGKQCNNAIKWHLFALSTKLETRMFKFAMAECRVQNTRRGDAVSSERRAAAWSAL